MADQDTSEGSGHPPEPAQGQEGAPMPDPTPVGEALSDAAGEEIAVASELGDAAQAQASRAFEEAQSRLNAIEAGTLVGGEPFNFSPNLLRGTGPDLSALSHAATDFNALVFGAWRTNMEATVAHWQRLAGARSLSEVIALNSEFVRTQTDRFASQSRDFFAATRTAADKQGL